MITAYLTLCLLHLPIQDPCWPERAVGHFDSDALCWAAVDKFMAENGRASDGGAGPVSVNWRCGGET